MPDLARHGLALEDFEFTRLVRGRVLADTTRVTDGAVEAGILVHSWRATFLIENRVDGRMQIVGLVQVGEIARAEAATILQVPSIACADRVLDGQNEQTQAGKCI